jgi:hypothetical protein
MGVTRFPLAAWYECTITTLSPPLVGWFGNLTHSNYDCSWRAPSNYSIRVREKDFGVAGMDTATRFSPVEQAEKMLVAIRLLE